MKSEEPLLVHGEVRVNTRDEENPKAEITATDVEPLSAVRAPEDLRDRPAHRRRTGSPRTAPAA